ncbi:hypothetical protein PsalN5692_03698 (plasmid) [Piscirickettsia salmonis]|nr:hypothetical protein PsalN5692_03698 [Piscirickettsia salmonis]
MTQNQNRPRWVESLENYSKALDSLNKVVELSGTVAKNLDLSRV